MVRTKADSSFLKGSIYSWSVDSYSRQAESYNHYKREILFLFSAAGAKAPRKISFSAHSCGGASSSDCGKGEFVFTVRLINAIVDILLTSFDMLTVKQNIGGNPYFPHETPSWQKEITSFFKSAAVDSMKKTQIPSNEESSQEITMVL